MSHLLPLLSALGRTGCEVHLLCLGGGGLAEQARDRGLSVVVLPMKGAYDPRVLSALRRVLRTDLGPVKRWDVVHTHGMRANLPVRMTLRTIRRRPCLFTTVHSDLRLDYSSRGLAHVYLGLDRLTRGGVDRVVCVSDALRTLLERRGYPAEQLLTVRSGLEMTGPAAEEAAGFARDRLSRQVRSPQVGTVARLVAVKDIDLMLQVVGRLRRTHPDVRLIIVGDGPEGSRLEVQAAALGLEGAVDFRGRVDDVRSMLKELDVYLVTSLFEGGVSMAVLEAMLSGLPVVATAAGGVAEAVIDKETGYVVERTRDRDALAAALAECVAGLLDDPSLRARMGAAGARRVRARFTVEKTAAETLRAYERCLVERNRLS